MEILMYKNRAPDGQNNLSGRAIASYQKTDLNCKSKVSMND